jgi:hypothetical protein
MHKPRFTHLAKMYGFNCYFNSETMEVKGTNWFNDLMIGLFIKLEELKPSDDGFVIQMGEQLPKRHKINRA